MARKSIVIIGAGIAGLCAGCYARMNGYETKILEMHTLPGGVCAAWHRAGYTIDSCIHWLVGSAPGVGYHDLWREVGAIQGRKVVNLEEYTRIEGPDGRELILYGDVDRLEAHLLALAPEDAREIRSLTNAIRRFTQFNLRVDKAPELHTLFEKLGVALSMLPFAGTFLRWRNTSVSGFTGRLKNPFLRKTFQDMASEPRTSRCLRSSCRLRGSARRWRAIRSAARSRSREPSSSAFSISAVRSITWPAFQRS